MKCLVMGGSGFIGRHLVKELSDRGDSVLNSDIVEPEKLYLNEEYICRSKGNPKQILESYLLYGIDEVYDLGAVVGTGGFDSRTAIESVNINIAGTLALLLDAEVAGVERFYYPAVPDDFANIYTVTKKAGEMLCKIFESKSGMEVKILRWGNVYGPGQALVPRRLIPSVITKMLNGDPVQIFGKGLQKVEMIYVKDVARITVDFLRDGSPGKMYDVDCQTFLSVNELVNIINEAVGKDSKIEYLPMRDGEEDVVDEEPVGDFLSKAIPTLFENMTPLKEGLLETIEWYRLNI